MVYWCAYLVFVRLLHQLVQLLVDEALRVRILHNDGRHLQGMGENKNYTLEFVKL
jgi:hypothetical protein